MNAHSGAHPAAMHRSRLCAAAVLLTIAFAALGWRLFAIQVIDHRRWLESAKAMRRSTEPILAYRGDIHLADGVILARDIVDYEIGIDPKFIPPDKLPRVVTLACDAMGKSPEYRRERLFAALDKKERGGAYAPLGRGVSEAVVEEIRTAVNRILGSDGVRGFRAEPQARRTYPRGPFAGSITGVTDAAGQGIEGIECSMEEWLSRKNGFRELVRDAAQKTKIYQVGGVHVAPVGGQDVYLTIDSRTQAIVEEELERGIRRKRAESGLFVLMDAHTGDILAMASYPSYDPDRFADYPEAERKKRRANRVVENLYEPGSVIKPFYFAYALEKGIIRPEDLVSRIVPPEVKWDGGSTAFFGRRPVTDVHEHPGMTFEEALVHSSNIAMALLGLQLGRPRIVEVYDAFGLCRPTGIRLPAEARGKYTSQSEWRNLYSTVSVSFGYELMVSPLQLVTAFAAVVNGGYLLEPRIVDRIVRDGVVETLPSRKIIGRPISEATSMRMRGFLKRVVEEGTARYLAIKGFEFGGKTGTADMARGGYTKKDYLASFEAFAPFENPRVVALCMLEKPREGSYYGGVAAGPIVVEVFRRLFHVNEEMVLTKLNRLAGRE